MVNQQGNLHIGLTSNMNRLAWLVWFGLLGFNASATAGSHQGGEMTMTKSGIGPTA